ncbi:MAG: hypothetical protein CL608_26215 [Anaerolineaceae bacterium]|nr:hypothetical protein [Anaerolineaceae bacterium]
MTNKGHEGNWYELIDFNSLNFSQALPVKFHFNQLEERFSSNQIPSLIIVGNFHEGKQKLCQEILDVFVPFQKSESRCLTNQPLEGNGFTLHVITDLAEKSDFAIETLWNLALEQLEDAPSKAFLILSDEKRLRRILISEQLNDLYTEVERQLNDVCDFNHPRLLVVRLNRKSKTTSLDKAVPSVPPIDTTSNYRFNDSIDSLNLSVRTYNALFRAGIKTINQVLELFPDGIWKVKNIGQLSFSEIETQLENYLTKYSQTLTLASFRTSALHQIATPPSEDDDRSINMLDLSRRTYNALIRGGVNTIDELQVKTSDHLLTIPNIGPKALTEIESELKKNAHLLPASKPHKRPQLTQWDKLTPITKKKLTEVKVTNISDLSQLTMEDLILQANLTFAELKEIKTLLVSHKTSFAKRWPQFPLINANDYQFLKRTNVPLEQIKISRLVLPTSLERKLISFGVNTVDDLANQSSLVLSQLYDQTRPEQVTTTAMRLKEYVKWLPAQADWEGEVTQEGLSPLHAILLRKTLLEYLVENLLTKEMSDLRWRKIIRLRFGLDGNRTRTLKEIGEQFELTRERIRQLEKRALQHLKRATRSEPINSLYLLIENEMNVSGGIIAISQIRDFVEGVMEIGEIDAESAIIFLLKLRPKTFHELKKSKLWGRDNDLLSHVVAVTNELETILQSHYAPLTTGELTDRLKHSDLGPEHQTSKLQFSTKFVGACLLTDNRFALQDDTHWGHVRWKKSRIDELVRALRKIGEPVHFTEIARIANEMLPSEQQGSVHSIHSQLGHHTDLFVWVGHGKFGLVEWGLKRPRFYADIAEDVLSQNEKPMTAEDVFERVNAEREASLSSITLMLHTNSRFQKFPENTFGLADGADSGNKDIDENQEKIQKDAFVGELKNRFLEALFDEE